MHELQRSCWSLYFSCLRILYALAVLLVHFFIHNPLARQQGLSFSLLVRIKHMRSRDVLECCRSFCHERRLQIACPIHFVEPVCVYCFYTVDIFTVDLLKLFSMKTRNRKKVFDLVSGDCNPLFVTDVTSGSDWPHYVFRFPAGIAFVYSRFIVVSCILPLNIPDCCSVFGFSNRSN